MVDTRKVPSFPQADHAALKSLGSNETRVGTHLLSSVPWPRRPFPPLPHEYTSLSAVIATTCEVPHEILGGGEKRKEEQDQDRMGREMKGEKVGCNDDDDDDDDEITIL